MRRTVQQCVVETDIVWSALHAWLGPINDAGSAICVESRVQCRAVDASAPRAWLARALCQCVGASITRRVAGARKLLLASWAIEPYWALETVGGGIFRVVCRVAKTVFLCVRPGWRLRVCAATVLTACVAKRARRTQHALRGWFPGTRAGVPVEPSITRA